MLSRDVLNISLCRLYSESITGSSCYSVIATHHIGDGSTKGSSSMQNRLEKYGVAFSEVRIINQRSYIGSTTCSSRSQLIGLCETCDLVFDTVLEASLPIKGYGMGNDFTHFIEVLALYSKFNLTFSQSDFKARL